MTNSKSIFVVLFGFAFAFLLLAELPAFAQAKVAAQSHVPVNSRYEEKRRQTNEITVAIMTSGMTCTCARFAEDIRNVVNDLRPGGIRVLPILGIGGLQNMNDVLFMKNMDMGIVHQDDLAILKQKDPELYANVENRVHYITKLYNGEFHVLARKEIKSLADLKGKKVNFTLKDSHNDLFATRVFGLLNIQVDRRYDDVETAIAKLLKGEIDATIMLTGAPQVAVAKLKSEDGVHLLSLDEASMPGYNLAPLYQDYLPGEFTHETYPNLIAEGESVQTLVNRALLVTYAWPENTEQYRKMAHFVTEFFGKIDRFKEGGRHPKWREVNLWADIPGWTRFKPAADWLSTHRKAGVSAAAVADPALVQQTFLEFLANRQENAGGRPLTDNEKEYLLKKVKQYLETEAAK